MPASRIDQWKELCKLVESDDGLPTRDAGTWTFDKLFWWHRYVHITTTAMVGNPKWPGGVVYVDLFAGPGVCKLDSGERAPGSPLIAVHAPKKFVRILLCEEKPSLADACEKRVQLHHADDRATVFRGSCDDRVVEICREIPKGTLTVACVDPTGLHAKFDTLRILCDRRSVDFMILFADHMDIVRNVALYASQGHSNLDDVLGSGIDWRAAWANLASHSRHEISKLFLNLYQSQLRDHLGYKFFADEVIRLRSGAPLYRLLYASRNERGLDFWKKITQKDRKGGRLF